jgi:hypothetical protein
MVADVANVLHWSLAEIFDLESAELIAWHNEAARIVKAQNP